MPAALCWTVPSSLKILPYSLLWSSLVALHLQEIFLMYDSETFVGRKSLCKFEKTLCL